MHSIFRRHFSFSALGERGMRSVAGVLVAALLLSWAFSVGFVAHAAGHDCPGHDCPVCALVVACETNLQLLGSGLAPAMLPLAAVASVFAALRVLEGRRPLRQSPVALKVRLNL